MQSEKQVPADCFPLEALEVFQSAEGNVLSWINYYFWLNATDAAQRFLFYVELGFADHSELLLTSGEDSAAIRVGSAADLVDTARHLQQLHHKVSIQRVRAGALPVWVAVLGKPLEAVRLTRNEMGLYLNDALLLEFEGANVLIELAATEGLVVRPY